MLRAPETSNSKSDVLKEVVLQRKGPEPPIAIEAVRAKATLVEAARKPIDMLMTTNMTQRSPWTTTKSNSRLIRIGEDD
jgi:hypothetical protein